jgi:hypothetical protein
MVDTLRWGWHGCCILGEKNVSADDVRINCDGDIKISGRPAIEASPLRPTVFAHDRSLIIPAARTIGLPLLVVQIDDAPLWRGQHNRNRINVI